MLKFHFLNVGKGNCTVIDLPSERLSIIDVDDSRAISNEERKELESLKKAALSNPIDYILETFPEREVFRFILSHPDMDHMSGIKTLFEKKYVRNFWDVPNDKPDPGNWDKSPYDKDDWDYYSYIRNEKKEDLTVVTPLRNAVSDCCWVQDGIKILSPNQTLIDEAEKSGEYDHLSYVLRVDYANARAIITGDATTAALNDIVKSYDSDDLKSDILLAPGHGSKNHVSKEFLDIVKPRLTVVSVAAKVDYDRDTYSGYGRVLSTKHYGNVKVRIDKSGKIAFRTQFQDFGDAWYIPQKRSAYYG